MREPRRIDMNQEPGAIESLGNGSYYFNYDIKSEQRYNPEKEEEETIWTYIQVKMRGIPNYNSCVKKILREYISEEEEFELINEYNAYQLGKSSDSSKINNYEEYIDLLNTIKSNLKKTFEVEDEANLELVPRISDIMNLLQTVMLTTSLTDEQALACKSLYPRWKDKIGLSLNTDDKVTYKGRLYKVLQPVNPVLENQPPSIDTASLYTEINESHAGTAEDPIPYNNNMELELGKYYIQNDVIYMCFRDTEIPVYSDLADLIDIYVKEVK